MGNWVSYQTPKLGWVQFGPNILPQPVYYTPSHHFTEKSCKWDYSKVIFSLRIVCPLNRCSILQFPGSRPLCRALSCRLTDVIVNHTSWCWKLWPKLSYKSPGNIPWDTRFRVVCTFNPCTNFMFQNWYWILLRTCWDRSCTKAHSKAWVENNSLKFRWKVGFKDAVLMYFRFNMDGVRIFVQPGVVWEIKRSNVCLTPSN